MEKRTADHLWDFLGMVFMMSGSFEVNNPVPDNAYLAIKRVEMF